MVLCIAAFFVNRSALPTDIMEARNIVTAREMVSDGNWLVPTMNGVLRLEKPPLPTWIAGAVEKVFPDSLSAQRFPPAVMGLLWTFFLFLTARYLTRREDFAVYSVVVFLTLYNVVLMGRSATWDIYCHAFMMGAIYFLLRGFYDDEREVHPPVWRWFLLSGLMAGLSFESKGPVSFYALLLPFLGAVVCCRRPSMKGKWGPLGAAFLVCLVLGAWWYVYLWVCHPITVQYVVHQESTAWVDHNVRPWYYYWRFFLEGGIWAPFILAALAVPVWRRRLDLSRDYLWVLTWMLFQLILLSLMPEKKMRYLLPMAPTVAMTVAFLLVYWGDKKRHPHWVKGFVWSVAGLFFVAELFLLRPIGKRFGNPVAHSIHAVRSNRQLDAIPFYYNQKEPLRIELVYEAGRKILPLDLTDSDRVLKVLPCVIISRRPLGQELPASLLERLDTVSVGYFDDNKHPKTDRHYSEVFLNYATLLKLKK